MQSLYRMIPSMVERFYQNRWYILGASGMSCLLFWDVILDSRGEQDHISVTGRGNANLVPVDPVDRKECKEVIASMWVMCLISGSGFSDCVLAEVSCCSCI